MIWVILVLGAVIIYLLVKSDNKNASLAGHYLSAAQTNNFTTSFALKALVREAGPSKAAKQYLNEIEASLLSDNHEQAELILQNIYRESGLDYNKVSNNPKAREMALKNLVLFCRSLEE